MFSTPGNKIDVTNRPYWANHCDVAVAAVSMAAVVVVAWETVADDD